MEIDTGMGGVQKNTEDRRERFERLAKSRMLRVLRTIRLLGNLATPNYQWTENDVTQMERAIREQCEKTFAKFRKVPREKNEVVFSFRH
jgi:hypothetical protein